MYNKLHQNKNKNYWQQSIAWMSVSKKKLVSQSWSNSKVCFITDTDYQKKICLDFIDGMYFLFFFLMRLKSHVNPIEFELWRLIKFKIERVPKKSSSQQKGGNFFLLCPIELTFEHLCFDFWLERKLVEWPLLRKTLEERQLLSSNISGLR